MKTLFTLLSIFLTLQGMGQGIEFSTNKTPRPIAMISNDEARVEFYKNK